MRTKKLLSIMLLIIILLSQFSSYVYAIDNNSNVAGDETKWHYDIICKNAETDNVSKMAKKIYDAMDEMYRSGKFTNSEEYDIAGAGFISQADVVNYKKGDKSLINGMNAARYAFYADHPEIFYVDFSKITIRVTQDGGTKIYKVNIGSGIHENYYINGFNNQEEVKTAINEFETRVNEIVNGAKAIQIEEGENIQEKQVKYVHNEIINNVSYRLENECQKQNMGFLGTPYGALVKKQSVCEGYARAFKTILDKLGITCILVQGIHQYSGEVPVDHMWNYVRLDENTARQISGKWYAVDCTQDDPYPVISEEEELTNYIQNFDTYGKDNFENTKYLLVGALTMSERHRANPEVEAAGDYKFEYPELEDDNYGIVDTKSADGLSVTYRPDASGEGDSLSSEFTVNYRGMGAAKAEEQGIYMLMRYYYYDVKNEKDAVTKWAYILPEVYTFGDYEDHFIIYENSATYLEFAVTDKNPGELKDHPENWVYKGDESDFIARTEKLYNKNNGYLSAPYVKKQSPAQTSGVLIRERPYHVTVTWDEELEIKPDEELEALIECNPSIGEGVTGSKYSTVKNISWNGTDTVEFDFTFSKMFADDTVHYNIYIKGLQGKYSKKVPMPAYLSGYHKMECPSKQAAKGAWNLYAKPTLIANQDLSMNDWTMYNGVPVDEVLRNRIALVATSTTAKEQEQINNKMNEALPDENLVHSETYNISLTICKSIAKDIKNGHKITMKVGFPDGYGPESEGVTFKAYHFSRDNDGNIISVEPIDCVVTQYGLIITCNSFSPFLIGVAEDDGTNRTTKKAIIATADDGGTITTPNKQSLIMLDNGESTTLNIKPDEGYEIESLTVCGELKEITNKDGMNITVNYTDIKDGNSIVNATFVAKTVAQKEKENGETVVLEIATPAMVTEMPKSALATLGKTLTIAPVIKDANGVITYQWYKDGERLEGRTNKKLTIDNVTEESAGSYVLKVTTTLGTTSEEKASEPCIVTVSHDRSIVTVMTSEKETIEPGEEFELEVKVNNLSNIEEGIIALEGAIEYDKNVLNMNVDSIEGANNWDLENGNYNEDNSKFITEFNTEKTETGTTTAQDGTVFKMKFKVADDVNTEIVKNTTIKLTDIKAGGGGDSVVRSSNAEFTLALEDIYLNSEIYTKPEGTDFISKIVPGTKIRGFIENITTNGDLEFTDKNGNVLSEDDIVKTGTKVKVGLNKTYTLVVIGDIDGDGEITVNDLAKLKLHCIKAAGKELTGVALEAAKVIEPDTEFTNSMARIKLVLIGKAKIK